MAGWNPTASRVVQRNNVVPPSGRRPGSRLPDLLAAGRARPAAAPLAAPSASPPAPQARTLANGLKVVVIEDHAVPVAQVHMWYRFGALDETPGKTGLAHALEHMMFRGTHDLSSAGVGRHGIAAGR